MIQNHPFMRLVVEWALCCSAAAVVFCAVVAVLFVIAFILALCGSTKGRRRE